jgi:hypothetical protein
MARFGGLAALLTCLLLAVATAAAEEPGMPFGPGVPLVAVGGSGPGGQVAVRPDGAGGYLARTEFTRGQLTLDEYRGQRIAGALVRSPCERWRRGGRPEPVPPGDVLTEWTNRFGDVAVPAAWLTGPLALVLAADGGAGPARACGDVPLAGIEAFEPLAGRGPATAPFVAPAGAGYGGRVSVWPTPSGHFLVRVDLGDRSGNRIALAWTVAEGSCAAWATGRPPPLVTDAGATRLLVDSDGRERRIPHQRHARVFLRGLGSWVGAGDRQWQSLLVHEWWPKGTAEGAVSVSAALPGGGVVCADLPVAAARAAGSLPRTGSPSWWVAAVLGGGLLAAGAALRRRPEF